MPQWAGSCWYYLRYCDPTNSEQFLSPEARDYWLGGPGNTGGVDLYIGGTEHAVLHLLYARFWHKILNDLGHLNTPEPFQRLVNQGLIMGEDGRKMSKSLGNVINPDDVVAEYGADAFRLYEMFMGPLEQVKPWNTQGVEGVSRFLAKVWRVAMVMNQEGEWAPGDKLGDNSGDPALLKIMHATIKKVGEDIEKLRFNTAISQMMECINAFKSGNQVPHDLFRSFLILLNPFAPHLTEELWEQLKYEGSCLEAEWPAYDKSLLVEEEIEMVVQVNGKVRSRIQVAAAATKEELESSALTDSKIADLIEALTVRKVIVVPGRLVNIVAN